MKMRPVGAELFRADRQMDMAKLIGAFHNFANASKSVFIGYRFSRFWLTAIIRDHMNTYGNMYIPIFQVVIKD
jgi:hypothetical protein